MPSPHQPGTPASKPNALQILQSQSLTMLVQQEVERMIVSGELGAGAKLSENALRLMASRFEKVYLKIHPADVAERNDIFRFYTDLANEVNNIQIVQTVITANEAIEQLRPNVVVGSLGASMFDAFFFGCQPIFLFHLLPAMKEFEVCKLTLDGLGYAYIKSLDEIGPDYHCGVDVNALLYDDEEPWWRSFVNDSRNGLCPGTMTNAATCEVENK